MGVLYHERHYGYSLVLALTETGSISLKEGTIYPILARLDSEWVGSDQGPPRKYYALTSSGRQLFDELMVQRNWKAGKQTGHNGKKLVIQKA
ncbi:MAG: PadR family transcriptional regulator [Bryobacteraceae bacterium]|jgi:PadR family transcriptional regulator PadR